jgi:DNA-binding response OmpR family regulator
MHVDGDALMQRKKILIVDDDKDFLNLLNVHLKNSGYLAAFASDVPSALIVARKEKPDAILLDIGLPGGNGFMVMDRLRGIEGFAHIPIIVVSAQPPVASMSRALKAGAHAYLQKPVDPKKLLASLQKALGDSSDRPEEAHDRPADGSGKATIKILIVDDDKAFVQLLNTRLKNSGYLVTFASDVPSALGLVQREKPDLILLDIGLPGGDGFVLMDRLKAIDRLAHIPIIIVTAQDTSSAKAKALKAGAQAYFQKPIDHNELTAAIREILGVQSAQTSREESSDI